MELVDVGDSKSPGSDTVSVRVRPEALKGLAHAGPFSMSIFIADKETNLVK